MRELTLKAKCDISADECERNRECKSRERCPGYGRCGNVEHYFHAPIYPQSEAPYQYCKGCVKQFLICPHLILEAE